MTTDLLDDIKLLPCPFCGRKAEFTSKKYQVSSHSAFGSYRYAIVRCSYWDCGVVTKDCAAVTYNQDYDDVGGYRTAYSIAADMWNRRINGMEEQKQEDMELT